MQSLHPEAGSAASARLVALEVLAEAVLATLEALLAAQALAVRVITVAQAEHPVAAQAAVPAA